MTSRNTLARMAAMVLVTTAANGAALGQSAEGKPLSDPQAFARGAKAWAQNCARCHNPRDPRDLSDSQWKIVMSHMRVRAGLTGAESRDILKFLEASN